MMGGSGELKMIAMMHAELIETVIVVGVVGIALLVVGWAYQRWYGAGVQTPRKILDQRFARGELSRAAYEEARSVLTARGQGDYSRR